MTFRAVETLKAVDLIAAEDTRNSIKLLNHFDIHTPMTSYHEHNKYEKGEYLVGRLKEGADVALITDAGTPAISDPGEELVQMCLGEGIEVTPVPGPSACVTALSVSGMPARRFCFEGFLPADNKEREEVLGRLKTETRTTVFYEAPHRLMKTLPLLIGAAGGERKVAVCRELTKKHETVFRGTLDEALSYYEKNEPLGEIVLVLEGVPKEELKDRERRRWDDIPIEDHMKIYLDQDMSKKDAMKQVAADRGISKRDVYQYLISL